MSVIFFQLKRGFVAANVEYDAGTFDYSAGCFGNWWLDKRGKPEMCSIC